MSLGNNHEHHVTARTHWAWLLPILALSPLALAAKGCDNTAVVGDNCPTPADCPSGTAGKGSAPPGATTCGGFIAGSCPDGEFCAFPADAACGAGDQTGTCRPKPEACDLDYSPVCGCDGRTYGNECAAQMAGFSVASKGECGGGGTGGGSGGGGTGTVCGGLVGAKCEEGLYCNYPVETKCGAGDQTGTCTPVQNGCTKELNQVCGCDDVTYGNPCMAAAAGVSIAHQGPCQTQGAVCGEIGGCEADEFCNFPPDSSCGHADGPGVCTKRPPKGTACDANYDPVCGCDGKTYGNECEAFVAAVSIASKGECGVRPVGDCGGLIGQQCKSGYFCDYPVETMCGAADMLGTCKLLPEACPEIYAPVCGCDGKGYSNACEANANGAAVAYEGTCKK